MVSSDEPAGITTAFNSGTNRATGLPHSVQNCRENRKASGTLNCLSSDSPCEKTSVAFVIIRLEACPVPEDFLHREQWQ